MLAVSMRTSSSIWNVFLFGGGSEHDNELTSEMNFREAEECSCVSRVILRIALETKDEDRASRNLNSIYGSCIQDE